MKEINNLKDLQKIKPMDKIKLTYFLELKQFVEHSSYKSEGIFAGSFNAKDKQYFVLTNTMPLIDNPKEYLFVSNHLYRAEDDKIINELNSFTGCCKTQDLTKRLERDIKSFKEDREKGKDKE